MENTNKNMNQILREVLEKIDPSKEDLKLIDNSMKDILGKVKSNISKQKIKAEVFVGGSFAKGTLIKKDYYDIDIFVRFDARYNDEELSKMLGKLFSNIKAVSKVHGSRDYYRVKVQDNLFIEFIPVKKISKPKEAENITDMSYSHVNYIKKKVKTEKIKDDIRIAKAFCYATGTYGAESYIKGFSGYAIELLVHKYKGFVKWLKAMSKVDNDKLVIDIERDYKTKQHVLMDLNSAKLSSPVILIDPTFPQRNALAALSQETFEKFKKEAKTFLKNPNVKSFEVKKVDLTKIQKNAKKHQHEFIQLIAKTNKQEGDIAGSKLLKFFKHLGNQVAKYFEVKHDGFGYNGEQSAAIYFVLKSKGEITQAGPFIKDKKSVVAFKRKHKKTIIKSGRIYSKDKITFSGREFFNQWIKNKNNKIRMKEMSIISLSLA